MSQVKGILEAYRELNEFIRNLIEQKETIEERIQNAKSNGITGMPRGGVPKTLEDLEIEKDELERRINNLSPYAIKKKRTVQKYIDTVHTIKHNEVLTMYYINCMEVGEIAEVKSYTIRNVYKILNEAEKKVDLSI